jgi:azurin
MHIVSSPLSLAVRSAFVFRSALVLCLAVLCLVLGASLLPVRLSAQAAAGPRTIVIVAGDDMKYDKVTIAAKPGEEIRIRLTPKGTMPKIAMSHNVVVLKLGTDAAAFVNAGVAARPTDFIAPDKKVQVIAATPLAGNGETVETTFKVPAAAGSYPYVCTFPGHFASGMKGTIVVKK